MSRQYRWRFRVAPFGCSGAKGGSKFYRMGRRAVLGFLNKCRANLIGKLILRHLIAVARHKHYWNILFIPSSASLLE